MAIETRIFCPLGKECESVQDGVVQRCAWYQGIRGKNPQGEDIIEEEACAIAWLPLLSVEMSQTNRGQTRALESFRDETINLASRQQKLRLDNG